MLAWWDYGYQISGMAKRVTLADGNTWNHEHIALVGLCLTSPEEEAHALTRHLADYVLVWKGGGSDDLGKSAHMARIGTPPPVGKECPPGPLLLRHRRPALCIGLEARRGLGLLPNAASAARRRVEVPGPKGRGPPRSPRAGTSVFGGHCAEADCDAFGVHRDGRPSEMMASAMIHKLTGASFANTARYEEVHVSRRGLARLAPRPHLLTLLGRLSSPVSAVPPQVRIVRVLDVSDESKAWAANASNRRCDAPGSWYCPGAYPPALAALLEPSSQAAEAVAYRRRFEARKARQLAALPKPNGPGLPEGSYLSSCRGCSLVGDGEGYPWQEEGGGGGGGARRLLRCTHCRGYGPASASTLDVASCSPAPAQVDNIQGELQCHPAANAPDVPAGGYLASCLGCSLSLGGALLTCTACSTADGRRRTTSYEPARCPLPATLDNNNGRLVCSGLRNAAGVPAGGYVHSCQGCALDEDNEWLRCSHCGTADGRQIEAAHRIAECASGRFDNQNGVLRCEG